jgi:phosphoserine phosphatase RsbU/P
MEIRTESTLRGQLEDRRERLREAIAEHQEADDLVRLLKEVDAALERMESANYGTCEICHESIDEADLLANPVMRYCLCDLTPRQQEELGNDLELASRIQAGLLPEQDQVLPGWEAHYRYVPAGVVSGDYCDLLPPRDGKGSLYFTIGDVSGKGVAASLLMAHLNASFRVLGPSQPSVLELTEKANLLLLESSLDSHYATMVCGRAGNGTLSGNGEHRPASAAGRLELCNAGHPSPLVIRNSGVESLDSSGPPIGLFRDAAYAPASVELEPGELLFLYTDGLSEARNAGRDEYGTERVNALLRERRTRPLREIADEVLSDLGGFTGGGSLIDDLTFMILRRSG